MKISLTMKKILLLIAFISFSVTEITAKRYYINLIINSGLKTQPSYYALTDLGLNTQNSWGYLFDNEQNGSYFFSPQSVVNYLSGKGWTFYELTETKMPAEATEIIGAIAGHQVASEVNWEHYILYKDCNSDDEVLQDVKLTDKLVKPQKTEKEKAYEKKHDKIKRQGDGVYQ